jgi:ABC-type uncharacterized transport system ATPase subunit
MMSAAMIPGYAANKPARHTGAIPGASAAVASQTYAIMRNHIESRHLTRGCQTRAMIGAAPLAVELKDVRKHFGQVQAVRDVDVSIASGEIVAMLGPNGAGKTSTIDIILGLSRQTPGRRSFSACTPGRQSPAA